MKMSCEDKWTIRLLLLLLFSRASIKVVSTATSTHYFINLPITTTHSNHLIMSCLSCLLATLFKCFCLTENAFFIFHIFNNKNNKNHNNKYSSNFLFGVDGQTDLMLLLYLWELKNSEVQLAVFLVKKLLSTLQYKTIADDISNRIFGNNYAFLHTIRL